MKKLLLYLILIFVLLLSGCSFFASFTEEPELNISLSFDKNKTSLNMGAMDVINLKASSDQNTADINWSFDSSIIFAKTDNYSAVITGLNPGTTTLTATCGSNSASCIITVSNENYAVTISNPYVYASTDFVNVKPNETVKISASLFGGTVADINGYTWSIDKPSVASLSTEGNYCWITGLNDGIAKLNVRHNKASYGYSVLINCSSDGTNQCYITTTDNIVTINLSETNTASFSIDLMNPNISEYASGFTYSVVDSLGNEISTKPVVVSGAGNLNVNITAYSVGECYVRCKHPSAVYDLDVLVRVIENAETAYIEPSQTLVTVSDDSYQNIFLNLMNYTGVVEPSLFTWSFSENAEEYIEYTIYNGSNIDTGDNINIKGIKTGTVKMTVSYPGIPSRNIIVLVRDIDTEASDATCYITTTQNYIRMKVGDAPQQINISLKNASSPDLSDLKWTITNVAADGSNDKVINWKNGNGSFINKFSRSIIDSNKSAYAVIEPLKEGTAFIDISHPKAMYSTRITVVVTKDSTVSVKKSVLNLITPPVINIKNGESENIEVAFSGDGNASDIVWEFTGNITVAGNGNKAVISAPVSGSGGSQNTVTVSHPFSTYPVKFSVVCYDNDSELEQYSVRAIYSYSTIETICTEQETTLHIETSGFASTPIINWNIIEGNDCIALSTRNSNKDAVITGIIPGKAVIKASCAECDDVTFVINVNQAGIINLESDCFLSTTSNVLYFDTIDKTNTVTIDLFNISSSEYSKLNWQLSNNQYEISANNNFATITSLTSSGSAVLTVTHPLSKNNLTINLRTGNQFEFKNEDFCYISTNLDVFELYSGQEEVSLIATLNHTESSDDSSVPKGFTFEIEDNSIATISYVNYSNTCYIKPVKNGTTKIFVRHPDSDFEKEVIIIVNNAPDASTIPYLTTTNNVITFIQGDYTTATVTLMNSNTVDNSLWKWQSLDTRICDVIANNGTSAMLSANSPGTCEIKVTHKECLYSLKLIVTVLDSSVIISRPYISTSSNIITLQKGLSTTLTAEMIGGNTSSDSNYFFFEGSSSALMLVNSVSGSCYIKALNTGIGYVTIRNTRYSDSYTKTVLVIIEDKQQEGVYISPSSNIVKIKPTEKNLTIVSASLINGEATDGKDFIWWADDYNLIGITPVAEQCSIMPTGRVGTTKLHVKHAKASKQADILVMVSNYDTFAFNQSSATISAEKLYFFPLQIPSVENDFDIKYSSSNEDVCLIQGSNSVAWVCGRSYGNASLTANMASKDGTVLATTEMLVSVTEVDPKVPVISLGNSILTVEAGTSRVISAAITGEGISQTEKFNLKWSVKNKDGHISLLDETADKVAYGSDCYVTFNYGGECVLTCTHEPTGASADIYFIIEEKGEIGIELNSNLETMFKDDGSITLTATLTNATDADYKNITWSAVKVGGQNIVAVSKAKGANCTVTPKNVGQTTVIAKLPNGKTASCIVIVKANTEITIDVGSLHVIPGYTEIINYRTNPENATINWYTQMTTGASSLTGDITNYFTIEDDTAKKQLRVTGLKDYPNGAAGTITASMVGASSANLPTIKVYVEYDIDLKLKDENGNNLTAVMNTCPDTSNIKTFNIIYYPTDLTIDIKKGSQIIASIPYEGNAGHAVSPSSEVTIGDVNKQIITDEGFQKCQMTVSLVPHTECSFDLTVCGTLPSDNSGSFSKSKDFYYSAYYDEYDIDLIDMTQNGAFTKFSKDSKGNINKLIIGDGEEAVFYLKIKNENAAGHVLEINNSDYIINGDTNLGRNDIKFTTKTNYAKPETERIEKAKRFFNITKTEDVYKISNDNITPLDGLIYLTKEDGVIPNTTVYHLGHAWDYYKDLPSTVTGNNFNNSGTSNSFFEDLSVNGNTVDYWLVTREMVFNNSYYAVPHEPPVPLINVDYITGTEKDDWWTWCCKHYYEYANNLTIKYNGTQVWKKQNNGNSGNVIISPNMVTYKVCVPYVITTEQLKNNRILCRPDAYNKITYKKQKGFFILNWASENYSDCYNLNKLISPYITPTTKKCIDNDFINLGSATLRIPYEDGHKSTKYKELTVELQKRECEAYTSGNWYVENTTEGIHYRMNEKLFESSEIGNTEPYFFIEKDTIKLSATQLHNTPEELYVPYTIYPKSGQISVTIPENSSLTLFKGYSSIKTNTDGSKSYTITSHESTSGNEAGGKLYFNATGKCDIVVTVKGEADNLNTTQLLNIKIKNEDNFVPELISKKASSDSSVVSNFSYIDKQKKLIIVGDGESINGKIVNLDSYSNSKINKVSFNYFTNSITENNNILSSPDYDGLVTVKIKNISDIYNFEIIHSKDYGYFATKTGIVDLFYNKYFSLKDIVFDENKVPYDIVYVENYNEDGTSLVVINEEETLKNKTKAIKEYPRRILNEQKINYLNSIGSNSMNNYTLPYYYDGVDVIESALPVDLIPVGNILIEFNDGNEVQEIIVCLKITQCPCAKTSNYGFDVPSSYYLNIEE